ARQLLGEDKIIGRTCNTLEDLIEASSLEINYIGFGPFKNTQTKQNISSILGNSVFEKIELWKREHLLKPIVGIGGIEKEDIDLLSNYAINGIAVSGTDLQHAIDCVLQGTKNEKTQKPSIGCNIKWK
ncbi:MAG: thiamine phosphate synthase, partial [Oceanihabitans sp.]